MHLDLSVVNHHWLMDCHKYRKRLPLKNYLVGDSIAPINDISEDDDEISNSQQVDEQVNLRKKDNPGKSNDGRAFYSFGFHNIPLKNLILF